MIASFNFSFGISSECHACKTLHSACKTSDRLSIAVLSANTCYVVAHSALTLHSVLPGGQFQDFFTLAFDFLNTYISFLYVGETYKFF